MRVILLEHTPEPEKTVATAARLCYSPLDFDGLLSKTEIDGGEEIIARVVALGHFSVLEHASFTYGVEGISRAASHQLVRHRIASFSQQSQRYVKAREQFEYVLPPSIEADPALRRRFKTHMAAVGRFYRELVRQGIAAEDARFVLPNASSTRMVLTMNARELRHFFRLRCCQRAQWEIRAVAEEMLGLSRQAAPQLFQGAGPGCLKSPCPEGKMTCGRRSDVRRAYRSWKEGQSRPLLDEETSGAAREKSR